MTTIDERASAGLSLLFAAGERPDIDTLKTALAACQVRAQVTMAEVPDGTAQIVVAGLTFDVDGLAPAAVSGANGREAVRLYPGAHLSGGLGMAPVVRALLALAAEITVGLAAGAVCWHPADVEIEPQAFSRMTLAWLAGGAFPAPGLVALTALADGSVVSRGLSHFAGQEIAVNALAGETMRLASEVVDHIVREGPVRVPATLPIEGTSLRVEPVRDGSRLLVWPAD